MEKITEQSASPYRLLRALRVIRDVLLKMKYGMEQSSALGPRSPFYPFGKAALVVILVSVVPLSILACRLLSKDASFALWIVCVSGIAMGLGAAVAAGFLGQAIHDLVGFLLDGSFGLPQLGLMLAALGGAVAFGLVAVRFVPEWVWESHEIRVAAYSLVGLEGVHRMVVARRKRN